MNAVLGLGGRPEGLHEHYWSNIKRWVEDGELRVIQRCRRCDEWRRTDVPISLDKHALTRKVFVESVDSQTGDVDKQGPKA